MCGYFCPMFKLYSICMNCPCFKEYTYVDLNHKFRSEEYEKSFSTEEALEIANILGIHFNKFDVEQFRMGMDVELEHGKINPLTNLTNDDPLLTGKITLAHLNEFPDYYTRLTKMESDAEEFWENMKKPTT